MVDDPTVQSVIDAYIRRSNIGMQKYKTTLTDNNGDILYWLKNLQEELMDATLYLERLKEEIRKDNNV